MPRSPAATGGASAVAKIDALGAASEAAVSHAGAESTAALAHERANAVAHLRQWQQESLDDLARTEQDAAARVTADFEEARTALLEQTSRATETVASAEESAADEHADAAIGELDAAHESALGALQERDATIVEAFDGAASKLRGQAAEMAQKLGDAAASAGGEVQAKLAGAERHGTADLRRAGATARGTLVAAVDDASAKTKEAEANYRDRLTAMHAPAAQALGQLASDGLAGQDQLVAKTGSEAQSAGHRIEDRSRELTEEAHRRSDSEQGNARTQAFLGFIGDWLSSLSDSVKSWLKDTFGEFWGGLIFGILAGLVMVAIGAAAIYVIGAMIGSAIAAVAVAGWVLAIVAVGAAVGFGIANRFAEFKADTGRDPSIWEGLGLVGLGIADLTGVPFVIEAIVGRRAFSPRDMSPFERGDRLGMGIVFVVASGASIVRGVARIRAGRPGVGAGKSPPVVDPPGAKPPVVDPPARDPPAPPAADPVPAPPPTIERAALARELGLDAQLASNLSEGLAARLRALIPGLSRDRVGGLRSYVQRALERGRHMDRVVGRLEAMDRSELAEFLDGQSGVRWEPNWRGNPHIEDGNAAEGWQHIVARHISETDPGGDLFATGTTRSEVQAAAVFAQRVGLTLEEIGEELAELPPDRAPTRQDWSQLSSRWSARIDQRIAELERLKAGLTECIGSGCLSLDLANSRIPKTAPQAAARAPASGSATARSAGEPAQKPLASTAAQKQPRPAPATTARRTKQRGAPRSSAPPLRAKRERLTESAPEQRDDGGAAGRATSAPLVRLTDVPHTANPVQASGPLRPDALAAPGRQSLSELLARILDQLSLKPPFLGIAAGSWPVAVWWAG